jgi:hypothetical protein
MEMEATTRRRSIGDFVRVLGRHRRALVVLALVGLLVGSWAWWAMQLRGLPDVGDPFDVAAFEAGQVLDEDNAYVLYGSAPITSATVRKFQANKKPINPSKVPADWSTADPIWREFLAESAEALKIWRAGSEKPDTRYEHPEGLSLRTLLPVTMEIRTLANLAVLEGSRLESEGDLPGAWGWYRAALRSSRHPGKHGFKIERLTGAAMHDIASKGITRWASDPRVDAPLLRRALDEVIAIDVLTVPASEPLKMEYLVFVRSLGDPYLVEDLLVDKDSDDPDDWCQDLPVSPAAKKPIQTARVLLAQDYDRSLRLARLMTANWIAELDKPACRRSKLAQKEPPIYEADPAAPPASRALPPEELAKWLESSMLASRQYRWLGKYSVMIDRERARQARLVVHLASELYRREHGGPPPSPGALVGPYLKALPECFDPNL